MRSKRLKQRLFALTLVAVFAAALWALPGFGLPYVPLTQMALQSPYEPDPADITLVALGGVDNIVLDWQIDSPLVGTLHVYNVYAIQPGMSEPQLMATHNNTGFVDLNTYQDGDVICYYVEAVDSDGVAIGRSGNACALYGELVLILPVLHVPPATTGVAIPISVINADGLCSAEMDVTIDYDATVVNATGVVNTPFFDTAQLVADTTQSGVVTVSTNMSSCQELMGGGALFEVLFDVVGNVDDSSALQFVGATTSIYDQIDPADSGSKQLRTTRFVDGLAIVDPAFVRGDVNGDGVVNADDASIAFDLSLGNINSGLIQLNACDVNGNDKCDSADATLILCYTSTNSWQSCSMPPRASSPARTVANSTVALNVGNVRGAAPGTAIQIPVVSVDSEPIAGGEMTFTYDPAVLNVTGVSTTGTILDGVDVGTNTNTPGILKVAFASAEQLNTDGTLLHIEAVTPSESANIRLASAKLNAQSGLDWESNLGNDINITHDNPTIEFVPTAVTTQSQQTSSARNILLFVIASVIGLSGLTLWKRRAA